MTAMTAALVLSGLAAGSAVAQPVRGDYDGDGRSDLAVGVPNEGIGGVPDCGAVAVLYGRANGLHANRNQLWHQDRPGIAGRCQSGDGFGWALASGDFDGDGFADLAVGASGERVGIHPGAGAVNVLYGRAPGLRAGRDQLWHKNRPGVPGTAGSDERFGGRLAVGDFNGDGFDDLVVAAHREDVNGQVDAGAVYVLYGSPGRLTAEGSQQWHKDVVGVQHLTERNDEFGYSLATGDLDGDGYDDLAVGSPGFVWSSQSGGVNVLFGHRNGLRAAGDQYWPPAYLDDAGVISDSVAWALAIADFDGDGYGDLAVGCPGSDVSGHFGAGAVVVLPGGPDGPSADGRQWLHEDLPPFDAATRDLEWFGAALTTGDWNGDGFADIAIGVPNEDSVDTQSGLVFAVYGDGQGLAAGSAEIWYQNSPGVANSGEFFDHLGSELTAGDYDGDGFDDLVLGVPEEDVAGRENAGVLHVIYGSAGGLGAGFQYWHQDRAGIRNRIDALDWFAGAVR